MLALVVAAKVSIIPMKQGSGAPELGQGSGAPEHHTESYTVEESDCSRAALPIVKEEELEDMHMIWTGGTVVGHESTSTVRDHVSAKGLVVSMSSSCVGESKSGLSYWYEEPAGVPQNSISKHVDTETGEWIMTAPHTAESALPDDDLRGEGRAVTPDMRIHSKTRATGTSQGLHLTRNLSSQVGSNPEQTSEGSVIAAVASPMTFLASSSGDPPAPDVQQQEDSFGSWLWRVPYILSTTTCCRS